MNLFFYSEESGFGGHETLALLAVRALLEKGYRIAFAYNKDNERLASKLQELEQLGLCVLPLPVSVKRIQNLRTPFQFHKVAMISKEMRQFSPAIVVVVQGRIESGTSAFLAARKERVKLVSYIPMAHPVAELAPGKASTPLKEWINRRYYRMPDGFITISHGIAEQLRRRGVISPVDVVENPVFRRSVEEDDPSACSLRAELGVDQETSLVAVIGRIDFIQKRQDWLVDSLAKFPAEFDHFAFLIVGEGPDTEELANMIRARGLEKKVFLRPWVDNVSALYRDVDLVLLCSRYEGVPLVMLEALQAGTPVVSPNIAGVSDWLPESWMFAPSNAVAMAAVLIAIKNNMQCDLIESLQERIQRVCQPSQFCERFESCLKEYAGY